MKTTAPAIIDQLVETFAQNLDTYRSSKNETELRREFLDKFFAALGWDVTNEKGYDEAHKEVVHEFSVEVAGQGKKADYAFRTGAGHFDFLVEAKKPSVKVESSLEAAFQLRRYGWSARLPLNILTDFEHLAVYDCRAKPSHEDKATVGRVMLIHYKEYAARWDEIAAIFAPEAVRKGSLTRYAEETKGKKGTADVDDAFLEEIERWRELLAKNIALRNKNIGIAGLNYIVQMTIDRIVFLRICEERGIEPEGQLQEIANRKDAYQELCVLFQRADTKYNSGLFHFKAEKGQSSQPDGLTLSIQIDDKVLKDIILNLYYPKSPYAFLYIPSDILGQVYERFLGKVIRLTAGHQAKVEEKPEVRKAGGVYYTPTYIVDYIVKNTVGKMLNPDPTPGPSPDGRAPSGEGSMTPKDVAKLKIVDPACGSGTFLLGAYQFLLDWHLAWYSDPAHEPKKWEKANAIVRVSEGVWRLTTAKKKEILLNNLFGVDIDAQAVEVTKLSLLLKVLENASGQLSLGLERALPDLGDNIKCGNSLIGCDYFDGQLLPDEAEVARVNPFDWKREFKGVFAQGGFDVVIGNPPYIQLSMADYYNASVSSYFGSRYSSSMGRLNTFGLFIEKVVNSVLAKNGYFSFIVPNTLLTQEYYQGLRKQILKYQITGITNYKYPVFKDAVVETIVFVICNSNPNEHEVEIIDFDNKAMISTSHSIHQQVFSSTHNSAFLVTSDEKSFGFKKSLDKKGVSLGELANLNQAIALKYDRSKSLFTEAKAENYKPVIDGRNINRYELVWGGQYLAYDVRNIHSCKRTDIFEANEKIFFRRVGDRLIATYDDKQFYALNTLVVITPQEQVGFSLKYLLGLINSSLLNFYYVKYLKSTKKVFSEIQARQLAQLPIRVLNFSDPAEKAQHDQMAALVEQMLSLHKRLPQAQTPQEKERLNRQIESTDRAIDALVYRLYGLTEEEIRIVEEKA
jgi:type I restriction-modification system DNA methylase subunit/predicted type IV restriction endonuclease